MKYARTWILLVLLGFLSIYTLTFDRFVEGEKNTVFKSCDTYLKDTSLDALPTENPYCGLNKTFSKTNVVLITIDALRLDHLGVYGYKRNTSPNIDSLAAKSHVFSNAYSVSGWTVPSMASLFTSLYPKQHHMKDFYLKLDDNIETLAETMQQSGYSTTGIVSNAVLVNHSNLQQGFDEYDISVLMGKTMWDNHTSKEVTDLAIESINETKSPFFLWVHYMDPHHEYLLHPEFDYGSRSVDRYDSEVAYTDFHLGRLLSFLEQKNLMNDTLLVITADHGEEFYDHGQLGHTTLFQEVVRIPLIIKIPNLELRVDNACVIEQIDLAPTILELIGLTSPSSYMGESVFSCNHPCHKPIYLERELASPQSQMENTFYSAHAVIVDNQKLMYMNNTDYVYYYLFNLEDDPDEKENLLEFSENEKIDVEKIFLNRLFTLEFNPYNPLKEYLLNTRYQEIDNLLNCYVQENDSYQVIEANLEQETIARLKSMGYIQ